MNRAAACYQKVGSQTGVVDADPHRLITMLMDGAIDRIHRAKGHIDRHEVSQKGEAISGAISILGGLQASLNMDQNSGVADNLDALYDYMSERLFLSSRNDDPAGLDEVAQLLGTIRDGWTGIRPQIDSGEVSLPTAN